MDLPGYGFAKVPPALQEHWRQLMAAYFDGRKSLAGLMQLACIIIAIGGIGRLVNGKTVTLKINMTAPAKDLAGLPASRTYHVHPNVVAAACAALAMRTVKVWTR